jgi:hypothetical protein
LSSVRLFQETSAEVKFGPIFFAAFELLGRTFSELGTLVREERMCLLGMLYAIKQNKLADSLNQLQVRLEKDET